MGMVRGKYYHNLFAGHHQYLQMAYYEVGKFEESYRAGLSYLLFNKGDVDMLNNLKTIEKETKGMLNENFFKVRREASEYLDRNLYEDKLAAYIKEEFNKLNGSDEESILESSSDDQEDDHETDTKDNDADNEIEQNTFMEEMVYQTPSNGYQRDEL